MVQTLIQRDFTLALRSRFALLNPLLFYLLVLSLLPITVGHSPELLRTVGPGMFWIAALFAGFLTLDQLFRSDYDDGSITQLLLAPFPLSLLVLAKVVAHWLVTGVPLALLSPLLAQIYYLSPTASLALLLSLLIGTLIFGLLGAVAAAITLTLRDQGLLLALLVFPLFIPVLILGTVCVWQAQVVGMNLASFMLLAGVGLLAIFLLPWAIAGALRTSIG